METTNNDAASWIAGFTDYLHDVVGATDSTRVRYLPTVRCFIAACSGSGVPDWTGLSVQRVTGFIREEAVYRSRHGRTAPASATRSFLRFLAWRGVVPTGLDRPSRGSGVHGMPACRRTSPRSNSRGCCGALPRLVPAAYRDRAILLLLAGLGLRAGEVAALELDDLD